MSEKLAIAFVGHRGDGVAETENGQVFVPYSLPGEILEAGRTGDRAEIISILEPSPDRVNPLCIHFGTCGGCAVQHWREDKYREWKRGLVIGALDQAGVDAPVGALIDAHGEGRRRAVLHARRGAEKRLMVGFSGRRSHAIIPIDECPVFAPSMRRVVPVARRIAAILESSAKPLDLQFTATEIGLDVDVRGSGTLKPKIVAQLASIASEEKLARITRHGEMVAQIAEPFVLIGKARVALPPGGFLQATLAGEEALAEIVGKAAGKAKNIADLFCGIGTFALRLAGAAKVTAMDFDAVAIVALKRAANTPGLKPVDAHVRDLFRRPLSAVELRGFDLAVMDPPRQGAEGQARELASSKIEKVVYISCNPASFARDAKILAEGGLRAISITPIDQFRYSAHVELAGVFER